MMQASRQHFYRRVGWLVSASLAIALASAIGTNALLPSTKSRSYQVVHTAISTAASTVAFADSDMYGYSPEDVDRALDLMRASGVSTVRIFIPWAGVQPTQDAFNWGQVDTMVNAAVARNMAVLGILNSTPDWAGSPPLSGQPQPGAYGDYAGLVADRYRGRISAYEIWNEENVITFLSPPEPAAYTGLLKAAYPKIKAADPAALVVMGGLNAVFSFGSLTVDPAQFMSGVYAAGGRAFFDAAAYHPYNYTMKFSEGGSYPISALNQVAAMHKVMADNGDGGKKIWATEYGEPTSAVDEATQAAYIADMLAKWRTLPYGGPVFIYTTRDRNTGSSSDADTLGVYRSDWTPKPAQRAVAAAA
jgi:polysaccharide biosynthesis protein PslG